MRNAFVDVVLQSVASRPELFVVSGDAGLGVFDTFRQEHPERFLNLGVAEQNATGFAAGLALSGMKVYLYNIIPFTLFRPYEQVRNDICYQELPVVLVGIGSGLTYSPQGMTHYSLEDVGIARTLPNLTVISPADPVEARAAARFSLQATGPVYVRLAKKGELDIHSGEVVDVTRPQLVADGCDVAIVFHGSIATEALRARELLREADVSARLVSVPTVQPLAVDALFEALEGVRHVVSVEEHFLDSGLGAAITQAWAGRGPAWRLHTLGVKPEFVHAVLDQSGMREHYGISGVRITDYVRGLFER